MAHKSAGGVAYSFWLRVERERVARRWSKLELANRAGIAHTTIDRLRDGTRPPQPRVVTALATVLGFGETEALQQAGVLEPDLSDDVDVRDAIARSSTLSSAQKDVLLGMVDLLEDANSPAGRRVTNPGQTGDAGQAM